MVGVMTLHRRKVRDDENGLSFKTPEEWAKQRGIDSDYEGMIFDRQNRAKESGKRLLGVGHKLVDHALRVASGLTGSTTALPQGSISNPLLVFRISDRVTAEGGHVRSVIVAAEVLPRGSFRLVKDWELLEQLNAINPLRPRLMEPCIAATDDTILPLSKDAEAFVSGQLGTLGLGFRVPQTDIIAVLWPEKT
jgi:hypothetical protein